MDPERAGGATTMPVELVILDDRSDATKTVAQFESLGLRSIPCHAGGDRA
jgi:hypothetical protein